MLRSFEVTLLAPVLNEHKINQSSIIVILHFRIKLVEGTNARRRQTVAFVPFPFSAHIVFDVRESDTASASALASLVASSRRLIKFLPRPGFPPAFVDCSLSVVRTKSLQCLRSAGEMRSAPPGSVRPRPSVSLRLRGRPRSTRASFFFGRGAQNPL
jgi:hypothetical protein